MYDENDWGGAAINSLCAVYTLAPLLSFQVVYFEYIFLKQ